MKSCFKCLIRLSSAQNMVWFHEGANNNHFETNTLLVVSSTQVLGAFVLVFIQAPTHAIIQISITQAFSIHFFVLIILYLGGFTHTLQFSWWD